MFNLFVSVEHYMIEHVWADNDFEMHFQILIKLSQLQQFKMLNTSQDLSFSERKFVPQVNLCVGCQQEAGL